MDAQPIPGGPLVGNDVVDLEDEEAIGAHLRDRFVQRVLAAEERERLSGDPEPHARVWAFFAAKEAAYKVAVKKRPETIFAHRRFLVAPDFGSVRFEDLHLSLQLVREDRFVHAIAFEGGGPLRSRRASGGESRIAGGGRSGGGASSEGEGSPVPRWGVARLSGDDPSAEVRRRICEGVGLELGLDPDELEVVRDPAPGSWDGRGPPRLLHGGRPLSLDVSLSHHGQFVAWAFLGPLGCK